MPNPDSTNTPEFSGRATYCPEDNKLRLYIGRVPREEYLKLRDAGWKALHKQREAGGGDFVAHWTPERRDTALEYAGIIEDEDMGPEERAADRAERFGVYRDKRTDEAAGRADTYDAGPSVHGYQSQARAERAAARHDRIAARACDAWSKAEYWQRRTAGVIAHALHICSPSVRMGRIKELEADLRRHEKAGREDDWTTHYRLRLAYENQMLEAQGGRAGVVEMEVGGTWLGGVIAKINKSSTTGRVVSVQVVVPAVSGWHYRVSNVPGTAYALAQFETERAKPESYQVPTDASRAKLAEFEQAKREPSEAYRAKVPPCPLVNPTDEDAEKIQAIWNQSYSTYARETEGMPTVLRCTQAVYSANAKGSFARVETAELTGGAFRLRNSHSMRARDFPAVAKVRACGYRVVVLTDKPQKPMPAAVWHDPRPGVIAELETEFAALDAAVRLDWLPEGKDPARGLLERADMVGLVYISSMTQFGFSDLGHTWAKAQREKAAAITA